MHLQPLSSWILCFDFFFLDGLVFKTQFLFAERIHRCCLSWVFESFMISACCFLAQKKAWLEINSWVTLSCPQAFYMPPYDRCWGWRLVPTAVTSVPTLGTGACGTTQLPGSSSYGHHLLRPHLSLLRSPEGHCCPSEEEGGLLAPVRVSSSLPALCQAHSHLLISQNDGRSTSSFLSHCPSSTSRDIQWRLSLPAILFPLGLGDTEPSLLPLSLNKPPFLFPSLLSA